MERFSCRTQIISGAGALSALGGMGIQRLLVVSDPFFANNGGAKKVITSSKATEFELFSKISPDPSVELAAEGTSVVRRFRPDAIAALGGGSAMDCAKAMAYFSEFQGRLIAIPTTSGSGSEVTDFAILTHDGVKHPLVDQRLRPDTAILEEEFLQELPPQLVAEGGFDLLSHCVESYVAANAGAISDALAENAFQAAFAHLPASFAGDRTVRLKIHMAATMAGLSFSQAGLGLCHAISHALGGAFHVPHGKLNAILLPAVIGCNSYAAGNKYARLARAAGLGGSADTLAVRNLKNALIRLRRDLKLPQTLAQAGIDPRQIWHRAGDLTEAALADPCCATNPTRAEAFMVRRILEEVTGRV